MFPATRPLPSGARSESRPADRETLEVTLLELVTAISEVTEDDREVVATVLHLLRSGRVRLCGNFRNGLLIPL